MFVWADQEICFLSPWSAIWQNPGMLSCVFKSGVSSVRQTCLMDCLRRPFIGQVLHTKSGCSCRRAVSIKFIESLQLWSPRWKAWQMVYALSQMSLGLHGLDLVGQSTVDFGTSYIKHYGLFYVDWWPTNIHFKSNLWSRRVQKVKTFEYFPVCMSLCIYYK